MNYLNKVKEQLIKMSQDEKDEWILLQAKLISEDKQKDFFMSLSGQKKIINMPSIEDIEKFYQQIENGEIYFEYETHYNEFDDFGNYVDDWSIWYNDPFAIAPMIDKIFSGCHQLIFLEEYKLALDIFNKIFELKFFVEESDESEDMPEDEYISLSSLRTKGMLLQDLNDVGTDWIKSYVFLSDGLSDKKRAQHLIEMFENSICKMLKPRILKDFGVTQEIFSSMEVILREDIKKIEMQKNIECKNNSSYRQHIKFDEILSRKNELVLDIRIKCLNPKTEEVKSTKSKLAESWEDITEVIAWLRFEKYIDDQPQIDTIIEICEELISYPEIKQENWELRQSVLNDIVAYDYCDVLGCSEIMRQLAEKLCANAEEYLIYADIMYANGYREEAVNLYYQFGNEDKYVSYYENNKGQNCKEYNTLITYYKEHQQEEKAIEIAQQGLKMCKDDLTDIFIFLLLHTKESNDENWFNKLYASAKRRKHVNIEKINNILNNSKS